MKRIFYKYETIFCIALIIVYVVVNSYCVQNYGTANINSVIINSVLSLLLLVLMLSLHNTKYYGLAKVKNKKEYLYFLPLLILSTINFWGGINLSNPANEVVLHMLTMANIGFIEEVIFRGFLFKMMEKSNIKIAIFVNAITFGIGHIVNLINGADIIPTILQICYATAIGYLFVTIFYRSKSIIPCIITHIIVNATSIFAVENTTMSYVTSIITILLSVSYATFIGKNHIVNKS